MELQSCFIVGAVEEGHCGIDDVLTGQFRQEEVESLQNQRTGGIVLLHVESEEMSEDQANDLLGLMRD
ncbi:hypothetical protein FHW69_001929 [Luteibacter sp. Sphag1AF]|uniref:hypothetical protein n=1 Tax=Luteibacter sp. Sphag1AF TaxID=2587031 RepID=UPI00160A60CC|nr:hypothetical protein [Luteibacter sp. Sphag1AF]MBB3227306.1 hypothetical protein [Luteibacter sp. Sphag1AF]